MVRSKHGLKALCLCLLALILMALDTSSAQAELSAHWNVNGKSVPVGLFPFLSIKEFELLKDTVDPGHHVVLLSKIVGLKVAILCSSGFVSGFTGLEPEGGVSGGAVKFLGCQTKINGTTSTPCEPHSEFEKGVILVRGKGLIVLHEGAGIVRVEPTVGETLTIIETSAKCSVGEKIPLIGKATLKDCQGKLGTEQTEHLVEEGPLTELWLISKSAEHKATVDGSAILTLAGSHTFLKWSGTPG